MNHLTNKDLELISQLIVNEITAEMGADADGEDTDPEYIEQLRTTHARLINDWIASKDAQ